MPSVFAIRDDIAGLGPGVGADLLLQLGPIFFGLIWNWFLLGTLVVQVYYYYLNFKNDSRWMKALVYAVLLMDITQSSLSTHSTFHTFVLYYGNPQVLQTPAKTVIGLSLFGGLIGGTVQLFYAWRIWTLGRYAVNKIILSILVTVIVLTTVLATVTSVTASFLYLAIDSQHGIYITDLLTLYTIWVSASFAVDTIVAIAMWALLTNAKTNTTFRQTNDLVTKLLIRAIATGALNAIVNGLEVLFLLHWPANDLSEVPSYLGGKLYSNAFMSTLNARRTDVDNYIINTSGNAGSTAIGSSPLKSMKFANPSAKATGTGTDIGITSDIQLNSMGKRDVAPYDYSVSP